VGLPPPTCRRRQRDCRYLASGEQLFYRGLMSDELEDVSLSQYDERTRRGLERVKPRNLATNPRCPDCWDGPVVAGRPGPMMHPAHPFGPCQVTPSGGEACSCTSERST
jgi:hypothetical protein